MNKVIAFYRWSLMKSFCYCDNLSTNTCVLYINCYVIIPVFLFLSLKCWRTECLMLNKMISIYSKEFQTFNNSLNTHLQLYSYACTHMDARTDTHKHAHTHIHAQISTYAHMHKHTHKLNTHNHTFIPIPDKAILRTRYALGTWFKNVSSMTKYCRENYW